MRTLTKVVLISGLFLTNSALADNWLCKEEASQRRSNIIISCGIGMGQDEDSARAKAFEASKDEFKRVCEASSDCIYHQVVAVPKRTDCSVKDGQFVCHRLVEFTIGEGTVLAKSGAIARPTGKIKAGMTAKQVIATFGNFFQVKQDLMGRNYLSGEDKNICEAHYGPYPVCIVNFQNGKVSNFSGFKAEYMANDLFE